MEQHIVLSGVGLLLFNPSKEILLLRELSSKPQNGKVAGMLSMPLETIEPGETPDQALQRMIYEEVDAALKATFSFLDEITVKLTDARSVRLYMYIGECSASFVAHPNDSDIEYFGWMMPDDILRLGSTKRRIEVAPVLRLYLNR
jgi:ADP-ribose pyrophosphatase YjhB (NUDIX family)